MSKVKLLQLPSERTQVDWDKFKVKFLGRDDIVKLCKDSDYDTDGGFWDDVGDWFFGENFDYASLEKALTNFFNCCKSKLIKVSSRKEWFEKELANLMKIIQATLMDFLINYHFMYHSRCARQVN